MSPPPKHSQRDKKEGKSHNWEMTSGCFCSWLTIPFALPFAHWHFLCLEVSFISENIIFLLANINKLLIPLTRPAAPPQMIPWWLKPGELPREGQVPECLSLCPQLPSVLHHGWDPETTRKGT